MHKYLILISSFFLASIAATGADEVLPAIKELPRPVTSTYELGIGGARMLDTYISPLVHNGLHISLAGSWAKALPANPEHLSMRFRASLEGNSGGHPYFATHLLNGNVAASWGLHYGFSPAPKWRINAGGSVGFDVGGTFLPNNGNNPATANAWIGIAPEASVSYSTTILSRPVKFIEEVSLPSAGVFFSPEFGESYYEIWIGNRSGLAHFGWWGNCFRITNFIGAEVKWARGSLRLGYQLGVRSSYINHLNSQTITHSVGIGFVPAYRKVCNDNPAACYAEY